MQLLVVLVALCSFIATPAHADDALSQWQLPPSPSTASKAEIELGKKLFFDPRLFGESSHSCASCHHPGLNWSDPVPIQRRQGYLMTRQTPSLINTVYYKRFFWDGRSETLVGAIEQHMKELAATAGETTSLPAVYGPLFKQAFDSETKTPPFIAKALAAFIGTLTVHDTAFDRWIAGDRKALSASARKGFALFTGKANCVQCHTPPLFSDSKVHNIGLNTMDPGFYEVTGRPEHRNSFRTPQLRQVAGTPPYMHNGSLLKLRHVIDYYNRGGDRRSDNNELRELNLSDDEKAELVDFLESLSGSSPTVTVPQLPPNRY
jgi:cytochrome c peroxidase